MTNKSNSTPSNKSNSTFINMLKGERKLRGLTQSDMAEILGISQPFYTMIETGKRPFPEDRLNLLLEKVIDMDYNRLYAIYTGRKEADFNGVSVDSEVDFSTGLMKVRINGHVSHVKVSDIDLEMMKQNYSNHYNV